MESKLVPWFYPGLLAGLIEHCTNGQMVANVVQPEEGLFSVETHLADREDPTDAETAALQTRDIKQGGQKGVICQAAIARQEDPPDAND